MNIEDLFEKDIHRPINGVVKAHQLDENSVWQELDEFVVTRELSGHLGKLVDILLTTVEGNVGDKNGIWISGFFGCGKSHLLKVLSYVLENQEHTHQGKTKKAVDFFANKIEDAVVYGDLKRVVAVPTDTILFNIDSKADHHGDRDAVLRVFLKVLNEKQGYSGDHPHIAHLERYLGSKGKLADFHDAFERAKEGSSWLEERDAWAFHRDELIVALQEVLGQSEESIEKWVDAGEDHFSLTPENFAEWTKDFLDSKGPNHQVMFLVDEVGQFIGSDTHLMLSLQTITENLDTKCEGRAWVVVTAQEGLDTVLGGLKNVKQHDFSKIQGRFKTRLSLSSKNVDEVIKRRLLEKNEQANAALQSAYAGKHDILKNQLSFVGTGRTYRTYADFEEFADCYPFPAYQFHLVRDVFESIRKVGATGLHLSHGERSTLDAFQNAAKMIGKKQVGHLAPFHSFYPAVEGFLDTSVRRQIDLAQDNSALEEFDSTILKILFLIRYIDPLPGNVDNLVTLCVDEIDADKLLLRKRIEESLARLESETLISRDDDRYFFLTNEEQDISREIKTVELPSTAMAREMGRLLFEDILGDMRKHNYTATGRDFSFTRLCDDHVVGTQGGDLEVAILTPLGDYHAEFTDDRGVLHTGEAPGQPGRILIRLPDDPRLQGEVKTLLQTEIYVKNKTSPSLPETTKRILRDRTEENRSRRQRLGESLRALLADATYFVNGSILETKGSQPKDNLAQALDYLIDNAYPKMDYIEHLDPNIKVEIQSTLRVNDIDQMNLDMESPEANPRALKDLREYIRLSDQSNNQVVLHDLIEKRYGERPYGWPQLEVVLLVARLAAMKEIDLIVDSAVLPLEKAYDYITSTNKQRKVWLRQRESADHKLLKDAKDLGYQLFTKQGPTDEVGLFEFLKGHLRALHQELTKNETTAAEGYPGLDDIRGFLKLLDKFVKESESLPFLKRFVAAKDDLLDLAEDSAEIREFYKHQKQTWKNLFHEVDALSHNELQLAAHHEAGPAFAKMKEILNSPRPYPRLKEVAGLQHIVRNANNELISEAQGPAVVEIQGRLDSLKAELEKAGASSSFLSKVNDEFTKLLNRVSGSRSIAHILQARKAADEAYDRALTEMEKAVQPQPQTVPETGGGKSPETTAVIAPKIKKRRVIEAKKLLKGDFIETVEEMNTFLSALRKELQATLDAGERAQLK